MSKLDKRLPKNIKKFGYHQNFSNFCFSGPLKGANQINMIKLTKRKPKNTTDKVK
jgi:hypothetical protein